MTLAQLYNDHPKFGELFIDPRFVAILHYMRENIDRSKVDGTTAETLIYRGAHRDGWLDAINAMQALATPPRTNEPNKPQQLYASR